MYCKLASVVDDSISKLTDTLWLRDSASIVVPTPTPPELLEDEPVELLLEDEPVELLLEDELELLPDEEPVAPDEVPSPPQATRAAEAMHTAAA